MTAPVKPRFCWPVTIDATNDILRFEVDGTGYTTAALTHGDYYSPEALLYALGVKIAAQAGFAAAWPTGRTVTATLNTTGTAQIAIHATGLGTKLCKLKWTFNSVSGAIGTLLGFAIGSDSSATAGLVTEIATFTSTKQVKQLWLPNQVVRRDSRETSAFGRTIVESTGGVVGVDLATLRRRELAFEMLAASKVFTANESTVNEAAQHLWDDGASLFTYWEDSTSTGLSGTPGVTDVGNGKLYALDDQTANLFKPERIYDGLAIYNLKLGLVGAS